MKILHERILKLSDLEKAKELVASYGELEIHFDESNEYFKFLRVKFDVFRSNVDNSYRIVAIVYGPYRLYCRVMLTEDIQKEQVSLFVIHSFFEYLRLPENSNLLALITSEHELCLKEQDDLSLINTTTVPSMPLFVSPSCFISSSNVQLPKPAISKKQKTRLRTLKRKVALLTEQVKRQKEENQSITSQNEEWRKQKTKEYEVVRQSGMDLVDRFNISNQTINSLRVELEAVKRSNVSLNELCTSLQKEVEKKNVELDALEVEYGNLNASYCGELKQKSLLSNVENELSKTKKDLDDQKKEYDNLKAMTSAQLNEAKVGLSQLLERKENQHKESLEACHKTYSKMAATAVAEEIQKQKKLNQELKTEREKCANVTSQLIALKQEMESTTHDAALDCRKLRFINAELIRRVDVLNHQITVLSQPKPSLDHEIVFDSEIPLHDSAIWTTTNLFSEDETK